MKRALIAQHVPPGVITMDYAGLRTLDSIDRAEKVFGLKRFTIISQREHDERALLIAKHYGIDAIAYAADDVGFEYAQRAHIHRIRVGRKGERSVHARREQRDRGWRGRSSSRGRRCRCA